MNNKLTFKNFRYLSIMLFGMFFGSGNLIFPPMIGKLAGKNSIKALIAFSITAIILPALGVMVVSKYGGIKKLSLKVGNKFAFLFPIFIYLTIGPFLAIPRNGSIPLEIVIQPFIGSQNLTIVKLIFTSIFFLLVFILSYHPDGLVKKLGKYLTPILIILIIIMFIGIIVKGNPVPLKASGDYLSKPIVKGFLEGYNTMDILAALNYGIILAISLNKLGITEEKKSHNYSILIGITEAFILFCIYAMLTYIGYASAKLFPNTENGAQILLNVVKYIFGSFGNVLIGSIFFLACLSVCISLVVSISTYFNSIFPKISYLKWSIIYILISFIIANLGLNNILKFSIPILLCINPVSIMLVFLGLSKNLFKDKDIVFKYVIYTTLIISITSVFIRLIHLNNYFNFIPLFNLNLEWIIPSLIVFIISSIYVRILK